MAPVTPRIPPSSPSCGHAVNTTTAAAPNPIPRKSRTVPRRRQSSGVTFFRGWSGSTAVKTLVFRARQLLKERVDAVLGRQGVREAHAD